MVEIDQRRQGARKAVDNPGLDGLEQPVGPVESESSFLDWVRESLKTVNNSFASAYHSLFFPNVVEHNKWADDFNAKHGLDKNRIARNDLEERPVPTVREPDPPPAREPVEPPTNRAVTRKVDYKLPPTTGRRIKVAEATKIAKAALKAGKVFDSGNYGDDIDPNAHKSVHNQRAAEDLTRMFLQGPGIPEEMDRLNPESLNFGADVWSLSERYRLYLDSEGRRAINLPENEFRELMEPLNTPEKRIENIVGHYLYTKHEQQKAAQPKEGNQTEDLAVNSQDQKELLAKKPPTRANILAQRRAAFEQRQAQTAGPLAKNGHNQIDESPPKPLEAYTEALYQVQSGDTLSKIAKEFYGDAGMYKQLYEANKDKLPKGPNHISVGQTLIIPEESALIENSPTQGNAVRPESVQSSNQGLNTVPIDQSELKNRFFFPMTEAVHQSTELRHETYTVKQGDSLSKIAKRFYKDSGRYNEIYEANKALLKKGPDHLVPGMKLKIPN